MQSSSGFLMLLALYTFIALSNPTKKVIEPFLLTEHPIHLYTEKSLDPVKWVDIPRGEGT
jgi:hypothetical protein